MASLFQIRRGASGSLDNGELYYNTTSQSLQLGNNTNTGVITLAKLNEYNSGSFELSGSLIVSGNTTIIGNLTFGSTSSIQDTVTLLSEVSSSIIPYNDLTWSLGTETKRWNNIYANEISASSLIGSFSGSIIGMGNVAQFSQSVDLRLDNAEWTGSNQEGRLDLLEAAMSGSNRLYVSPQGTDTTGSVPHGTEHNPYKTIKAAVESLGVAEYTNTKRYTIFVGSGNYTEQNPIAVPPGVAIVGDNLRTVRLTAANPTKDYFHCHDGNYFYGLRFLNLQSPSFCFSYPCSTATGSISAGSISSIGVVHSMTGYTDGNNQDLGIIIEGPDASGSIATATANVAGGVITQINVVSGGTNYSATEKPHISIPAPLAKRPIIGTSPYIQNCSSITGPFTTDGTLLSLISGNVNYAPLPYNVNDVRNASNAVIGSGVIDEQGAGGGIIIDGNLVHPLSPLESFVADAFTQVNQGGPGHLVINKGYAQFVSCFTTFCTYGFKVANGGFANISNSVIDFGKEGLVSKKYFPQTYNSGSSLQTLTSTVVGAVIAQDGAGYTGSVAPVTITGGGASVQATAEATINANGSVNEIVILTPGSGYTSQPNLTIATPTGAGAIQATTVAGKANISGIAAILFQLESGSRGVDVSSNMILSGNDYLVTNVATGSNSTQRYVTVYPAPPSITTGDNVYFHQLSNISTGGLVMEYNGSGVTYNALPKFGGVPNRTKEIVEYAPGRVFYSTVDNIGNLKIGDFFAVNQLTGEVTIDANQFNLSGLSAIGPFKRNGVGVGVVLNEVSNNATLLNAQGITGEDTVPTQYAVKEYIGVISASFDSRTDNLEWTGSNHKTRIDNLELISASYNSYTQSTNQFTASVTQSLDAIHLYTSSLKQALTASGQDITIYGNLTIQGTQTSIQSTTLNVVDKNITLASGSTNSATANGAGINIDGANVTMSWNDLNQRIELNKDFAVIGSISSSTITGIGNVTTYSTSVDSRLDLLESTGSNSDSRLDSIETYTASVSTSVGLLQQFSGSEYKNDSSSFNSRLGGIENNTGSYVTIGTLNTSSSVLQTNINTKLFSSSFNSYTTSTDNRLLALELTSQSLNQYTASISTSVGLLQTFSSSQYNLDSSSFSTRISASTLTFNNTTGQTAIDFTQVGTQVSAIASGLTTGSNVQFNNITSSGFISASGTIYADTIVVNSLAANTMPVTEYETAGTLGNILIKGAASKSIQVVDSIKFTGLAQNGVDAYSATGLQLTGSLHVTQDITASGNLFVNGTIYATELHTIIQSSSVIFSSGSNQIGDQQNDILTITGSLYQTGSTSFSELSGSLFAFSASLNSRIVSGVNTLSSSIYQTDATQSNNILINAASALGAFQSASAYSASAVTTYAKLAVENTFTTNQIISGSLNVTGDVVAYSTSDERLKDNIQLISNPIEKVNQLRGVEFDWNNKSIFKAGKHDYGVIAQDVEKVLPELVKESSTGYLGVDYDKIIGLLIEVVKEQEKRIKDLENKIG